MRQENEPLKKWEFNFRGQYCKKNTLQLPSWTQNWIQRFINFEFMPARKKNCSHILSQSSPDYPPPIWSLLLRFDHSLDWLDFAGFVRFPFIFLMFAVNGSVQNPDIMQCNVIGSGFSTHFSLGVNWGSLMLSRFNFVLVYAAMPSLLAWYILYSAYLPSKFLEKHSCQYFWTLSILKMRGQNIVMFGQVTLQ